jgi:hypothetical protein
MWNFESSAMIVLDKRIGSLEIDSKAERLLREVVLNNMILFKYSGLLKLSFPFYKVKQILEDSLDSIPSPSVKIQIMGGNVGLRCKGKTLMGIINNFFLH